MDAQDAAERAARQAAEAWAAVEQAVAGVWSQGPAHTDVAAVDALFGDATAADDDACAGIQADLPSDDAFESAWSSSDDGAPDAGTAANLLGDDAFQSAWSSSNDGAAPSAGGATADGTAADDVAAGDEVTDGVATGGAAPASPPYDLFDAALDAVFADVLAAAAAYDGDCHAADADDGVAGEGA